MMLHEECTSTKNLMRKDVFIKREDASRTGSHVYTRMGRTSKNLRVKPRSFLCFSVEVFVGLFGSVS